MFKISACHTQSHDSSQWHKAKSAKAHGRSAEKTRSELPTGPLQGCHTDIFNSLRNQLRPPVMCCPQGSSLDTQCPGLWPGQVMQAPLFGMYPSSRFPPRRKQVSAETTLFSNILTRPLSIRASGLAWNPGSQKPAEGQSHKQAFLETAINVWGKERTGWTGRWRLTYIYCSV